MEAKVQKLMNKAAEYQKLGHNTNAQACYREVIAIRPRFVAAWLFLGRLQEENGEVLAALESYLQAVSIEKDCALAYYSMGMIWYAQRHFAEALECLLYAIHFKPDFAEAYCNIGIIYQKIGNLSKAKTYLIRAAELRAADAAVLYNLGSVLYQLEQYDEAAAMFNKALGCQSQYAAAHCGLAEYQLLHGKWQEGFANFEWRWLLSGAPDDTAMLKNTKNWQGQSFIGKSLLIYPEQGFGDFIQFVRYLPLVKAKGGRVILAVRQPLLRLLKNIDGADEVIEYVPDKVAAISADFAMPIMSIPHVLLQSGSKAELLFAERGQYIFLQEEYVKLWEPRIKRDKNKKNIGLVWAGSSTNVGNIRRSIQLDSLATLFTIPTINWYSLQAGVEGQQLDSGKFPVINLMDECRDFLDTAAFISQLDMVISVDTAVAHLAGALGRPVGLLLGQAHDWRWGLDSSSTKWYGKLKIFRQSELGNWESAVQQLAAELSQGKV